ncbi:MAG: galactose mutarotase [Oscillospiraceae bacterium]|nr:galactose mutarotase [Oscillospiraceae bacterium]
MSVKKLPYGKLDGGSEIFKFIITDGGMVAEILTFGAILDRLFIPAGNETRDVVLGYDGLEGYADDASYQGAVAGRYANRIAGGKFKIGGREYSLTQNEDNGNCLHGAGEFSKAVWQGEITGDNAVKLSYASLEGKNGFPGTLETSVVYSLENSALKIDFSAVSDSKTVINLTNHAYFNLNGSGDILGHELHINAGSYIPVDKNSIPTGETADVGGTPFDFKTFKKIGRDIGENNGQLENTGGYDHNFCVNGYDGSLKTAAVLKDGKNELEMTVKTTLPGVQLYTGNFLRGETGKNGVPLDYRTGVCLETQYYPDTPNNPGFPQCTFEAGEEYKAVTVFDFSVRL